MWQKKGLHFLKNGKKIKSQVFQLEDLRLTIHLNHTDYRGHHGYRKLL